MFITQPKIFISSTIVDLPNERKAALKAVEKVGGFPIMSEYTIEAQSTDSVTTCLSKVLESDIYVLILGSRYGWRPENKESITELEYQTAISNNIPVLVINTTYPKEQLQKEFENKVETKFFRKTVQDAFELQDELGKALKSEIDKKQNEYFRNTELVYSNLVKIEFPKQLYIADLDIDKKEINHFNKGRKRFINKPNLHDYAVSALFMKEISFPHDWIVWNGKLITFHNLQDPTLPLSKIIDQGTAEMFSCDEFYKTSQDHMSQFKHLLKKCLEAKLHKLKIKWIKDEKLFAFLPIKKDDYERWESRSIEWTKSTKKATRKVVEIKRNLKNNEEIFNMRCLAFKTGFEVFEDSWYLSIKPEWIFLWSDLRVCNLAFKNIQWLKKNERNMHVFNHFNFILRYLQPSVSESMFNEYKDYPFMIIGNIEKFEFAPIIPDNNWSHLENVGALKKLNDENGNVDLFGI